MNTLQKSNKLVLDLYEAATNLNCGHGDIYDHENLEKALIAFEEYFSVDGELKINVLKDGDDSALVTLLRQNLGGCAK